MSIESWGDQDSKLDKEEIAQAGVEAILDEVEVSQLSSKEYAELGQEIEDHRIGLGEEADAANLQQFARIYEQLDRFVGDKPLSERTQTDLENIEVTLAGYARFSDPNLSEQSHAYAEGFKMLVRYQLNKIGAELESRRNI